MSKIEEELVYVYAQCTNKLEHVDIIFIQTVAVCVLNLLYEWHLLHIQAVSILQWLIFSLEENYYYTAYLGMSNANQ